MRLSLGKVTLGLVLYPHKVESFSFLPSNIQNSRTGHAYIHNDYRPQNQYSVVHMTEESNPQEVEETKEVDVHASVDSYRSNMSKIKGKGARGGGEVSSTRRFFSFLNFLKSYKMCGKHFVRVKIFRTQRRLMW